MAVAPPFPFCPRLPRNAGRVIVGQALIMCVLLYLWKSFNGGWVPWFVSTKDLPDWPFGTGGNKVLLHFPETQSDGLKLTWKHGVNTQSKLSEALASKSMFLQGDVILEGQGTDHMKLVAIMADHPATESDLTLEEFLSRTLVKDSRKGLKINFRTLEPLEIGLESLRRMKDKVSVPIILHADILPGPGPPPEGIPLVDPAGFIEKVKDIYPTSVLSLGWLTIRPQGKEHTMAYTWRHVKEMYDQVKRHDVTQPLTFAVNAGLLRGSLQPLMWLCETLHATLTVYVVGEEDAFDSRTLAYFRYKFPKDTIYFDMPESVLRKFTEEVGSASQGLGGLQEEDKLRESRSYRSEEWVIEVLNPGTSEMLMGSQVTWLRGPAALQLSRRRFKATDSVKVTGSVTFLPVSGAQAKTAFSVFLFTSRTTGEYVRGIRCSVNVNGEISIAAENIPDAQKLFESATVGLSPQGCYQFEIRLTEKQLHLYVQVPSESAGCDLKAIDKFKFKNKEIHVDLDRDVVPSGRYSVILRASDSNAYTIVEEIKVLKEKQLR